VWLKSERKATRLSMTDENSEKSFKVFNKGKNDSCNFTKTLNSHKYSISESSISSKRNITEVRPDSSRNPNSASNRTQNILNDTALKKSRTRKTTTNQGMIEQG
jgi:hypothetical protein